MERKLVIKQKGEKQCVYAAVYYYTELNTARMLHDLNIRGSMPEENIQKKLEQIQESENIELDDLCRRRR